MPTIKPTKKQISSITGSTSLQKFRDKKSIEKEITLKDILSAIEQLASKIDEQNKLLKNFLPKR